MDGEHAVGVLGLHLLRIHGLRKGNAPVKGPETAFGVVVVLPLLLGRLFLLPGQHQLVSGDSHVKILRRQPRDLGPHRELLLAFGDVDRRRPAASAPKRPLQSAQRLSDERVEQAIDLAAKGGQRRFGGAALPLLAFPRYQTHVRTPPFAAFCPPGRRYRALTSILRGLLDSALGRCSVSTPSAYSAVIFPASIASLTRKVR